jgi:hypothetical protein
MLVREKSTQASWSEHLYHAPARWAILSHTLDCVFQWMAYFLRKWALRDVLEYLGSLSVLAAVIFYYTESGDHRKQKRYQAWQVINTAEGKAGGGAILRGSDFRFANLHSANLRGADASGANFTNAALNDSDLNGANLSNADLRNANLSGVRWQKLRAVTSVNIYGVRNVPPGFMDWAMAHGARSDPAEA